MKVKNFILLLLVTSLLFACGVPETKSSPTSTVNFTPSLVAVTLAPSQTATKVLPTVTALPMEVPTISLLATPVNTPTRIPSITPTVAPTNIFYENLNGQWSPLLSMTYFVLDKTSPVYAVNEPIVFRFQLVNLTNRDVWIPCVGALVNNFKLQCSYGDYVMGARAVLTWDDQLKISTPGVYDIFGVVCYGANRSACDTVRDLNGATSLSGWFKFTVK